MKVTKSSKRVRIGNLKPGLFLYEDTLCLKTEYISTTARCECYIVKSGEILTVGGIDSDKFNALLVTPLYVHD